MKEQEDKLYRFLKELLQQNKEKLQEEDFLLYFCLEKHWQEICSRVTTGRAVAGGPAEGGQAKASGAAADITKCMRIKKVADAVLYIQVLDPALRFVFSLNLNFLQETCNTKLKTIDVLKICNDLGLSAKKITQDFSVKKVVLLT